MNFMQLSTRFLNPTSMVERVGQGVLPVTACVPGSRTAGKYPGIAPQTELGNLKKKSRFSWEHLEIVGVSFFLVDDCFCFPSIPSLTNSSR